jgi:hypothetical protein
MAQDLCKQTAPALASPGNPAHAAACHLVTGAIRAKVAA